MIKNKFVSPKIKLIFFCLFIWKGSRYIFLLNKSISQISVFSLYICLPIQMSTSLSGEWVICFPSWDPKGFHKNIKRNTFITVRRDFIKFQKCRKQNLFHFCISFVNQFFLKYGQLHVTFFFAVGSFTYSCQDNPVYSCICKIFYCILTFSKNKI